MGSMHVAECGIWISDGDFFGHDIPGTYAYSLAVDRDTCLILCENTEDCNAVTYNRFTKTCRLKVLPPGEAYRVRLHRESDTIALCPADAPKTGVDLPPFFF